MLKGGKMVFVYVSNGLRPATYRMVCPIVSLSIGNRIQNIKCLIDNELRQQHQGAVMIYTVLSPEIGSNFSRLCTLYQYVSQ